MILNNGIKCSDTFFSVYLLRSDRQKNNLYTANIAKKRVKLSVERNRYKRWMRASYHKNKAKLGGFDVLIMPRQSIASLKDFAAVDASINALFDGAARKAAG
jgi:ribonuclease P protein component